MHMPSLLSARAQLRLQELSARFTESDDRGDVPGWVLVAVMSGPALTQRCPGVARLG